MKYCEDDLPVKIVFANDLLKFFGDALVAMLNEENPILSSNLTKPLWMKYLNVVYVERNVLLLL